MPAYGDVFVEALLARLLPIYNEVTLGALRHLQPQDYPPAALVAGAGALVASVLLYLFGIWLRRMPERVSNDVQRARIETMRAGALRWLPWLLILAPTPVGTALIMAAGFFRLKPVMAGGMIVVAEIMWRVSPLMAGN